MQLAVNVPDDAHPLRAALEKLRDVAMRGESRLDRHVLHDDVLHLKDVKLVRSEAEDEATSGEVLAGADVHLPGEEVAEVIVDSRVVLDVHLRREAHPAPMLLQSRRVVRNVRDQHEWPILIDLQARSKLHERMLVVHPPDEKRAVVDGVGRHRFEDGTEQSAERVFEERPELGMKDGVDVVGSSLPPRSLEAPETEGPGSLLDLAGGDVELSHDLGGSLSALLRDVARGRDVLLDAPQRPSAAVSRRSQEVLGRSLPGWRRRHGILNLPAATRDIDQAHVRVEDLEPFGLSRAGDSDVQDGEVEMRDTVAPELVHEPHIA